MAITHGVSVSEKATSVQSPNTATASLSVIVGTAPVNMGDVKNVNKPVLCFTRGEAVAACGYVAPKLDEASGLKKYEYTISEAIFTQFNLYGVAPVVFINVLDPAKHKTAATTKNVTLDSKGGSAVIAEAGILPDTIKLGNFVKDTDYVVTFDDDGSLVVTSLLNTDGTFKITAGTSLTFTADKLDPSAVTDEDIIGGIDASGKKSGLELVDEVFPRFRLVPGQILAPGFSGNSAVAAVLDAKAENINGNYSGVSLCDIPTETVKQYSAAPTWKSTNGVSGVSQIACYPMVTLDGVAYNYSSHLAGLIALTDSNNDDVPYVSPSNKSLKIDGMALADGTEVVLDLPAANYLNQNGIVTALNRSDDWVCWGNRTACYPGNTDVKDNCIPVRRMFSWVGNTLINTHFSQVDNPTNRRQIDTTIDSANLMLNGWTARQYILGGSVSFLEDENPATDLLDGISRYHVSIAPPPANEKIEFIVEYNPSYISTLFSE